MSSESPRRSDDHPPSSKKIMADRLVRLRLNIEEEFTSLRARGVSEKNLDRIRPELERGFATRIIEDVRQYDVPEGSWPPMRTGVLDARETAEAERLLRTFRRRNFVIRPTGWTELVHYQARSSRS